MGAGIRNKSATYLATLLLCGFMSQEAGAQTPSIAIYQPTGVQRANTTIRYVITDAEGSPVSLLAEYSTDSGSTWLTAAVSGDTSGIASADYDNSLVWQSLNNLANQDIESVWFRITPYDTSGWGTPDTTFIDIDNRALQWIAAEGVSGDSTITFWFDELAYETTATNTSNFSISGGLAVGSIRGADGGTDEWTTETSMPIARYGAAAGVIDGKLYVAGGSRETFLNALEVYDPSTNSWTTKASMPTTRTCPGAGVIDGKLYIVGGVGSRLSTLEVYDPSTDSWTTKTPMPTARSWPATGVINGKFYVASGDFGGDNYTSTLEVYDPATDSWMTKTSIPTAREGAVAGVIDGRLYVAGGKIGGGISLSTLEVYDPVTDSWTTKTSMPTARVGAAAGVINGTLCVAGGFNAGYLNTLEVYDPATDSWTTKTSMPTARSVVVAGVIDGKLFVAGGRDAGFLSTLEVYTAIPSRFELTLTSGQRLPGSSTPVTITASNISDLYGNTISVPLDTSFYPASTHLPSVAVYQPTGVQSGDVTVPYIISDPDSSFISLLGEYSINDGGSWQVASVTGDTSDIVPADYDSSLVWQSGTDLADQELSSVWFRITPRDNGGWGTADTTLIDIDNRAPQWIAAEGTSGDTTFTFWFNELVADSSVTNTSNFSLSGGLTAGSISGIDTDTWTTKTSMPTARRGPIAGIIVGKLYAVGGQGSGAQLATLEVYDPSADSWTTGTSMPTARYYATAGVIDGKLYIVGGKGNGVQLNTLEVYDPSTDSWMTRTSMPTAREGAASGVIDGKFYVAGGYNSSGGYLSILEVYDPSADSWTTNTSMPTARCYIASGVIDGELYVVGGWAGGYLNTLEVFDPATDSWTTKNPMPTARDCLVAGAINGKLYVAGGGNQIPLNILEVYDSSTESWTTRASMPTAREFPAAGVINGNLYLFGGHSSQTDLSSLAVYTALPSSFDMTLGAGETLSIENITLQASGISDQVGNIASNLDTTFTPARVDTVRPTITIYQPTGTQTGDVNIPFVLTDPDSSEVGFLAEYSTNQGGSWSAASVIGDTSAIAAAEYSSSLIWQSGTDLADQEISNVWFRLTPHDPLGEGTADNTFIDIDNQAPQWVAAEGTSGDTTLTFWFNEPVADSTATNSLNVSLSGGLTIDIISVNDSWATATSMPTALHGTDGAAIGGKLYVAGGTNTSGDLSTLAVYDPSTDSWNTATSMPTARRATAAAAIDDKLYVAGGYDGSSRLSTLEVYDSSTDIWTTATPMSTDRDGATATAIGGKLYVAGGDDGSSRLSTLDVYDPATDSWATATSMPTARSIAAAATIGGKLYVAGGYDGSNSLSTLEVYDPSTDSWTTTTPMPTARRSIAAAAIGGKLYVAGGYDVSSRLSTLEVYDPATDSWTSATPMPTARSGAAAAAIDGKFYMAGGWDSTNLSTLEVYNPQVNFEAGLTIGQTLPNAQVTLTATNVSDYLGNTATSLDTTFTPARIDTVRPTIAVYQPTGMQSGDVTVPFMLTDPDSSEIGLLVEYSTNQGGSWSAASVSSDTSDIAATDYDSSLVWQSGTDLADQELSNVWFRITPHDALGWGTADTTFIDIDNLAPQWIAAEGTVGDTALTFWFDEPVEDATAMTTANISLSGGLTAGLITAKKWSVGSSMSYPRRGCASAVIGGKLYVVGGDFTTTLEVYDPATDTWEIKASLSGDREGAVAVEINGQLYVASGERYDFSDIEIYDPATNSWSTGPQHNTARWAAAGAINGKLYMAGGYGWGTIDIYLRCYNPITNNWTFLATMPTARWGAASGVISGRLYVAGGEHDGTYLTALEVYDPATDTWTTKADMPAAVGYASSGVINGRFYIAGGWNGSDFSDNLYVYDPDSDTWTTESTIPSLRYEASAGVINDRLYIAGGYYGGYISHVDIYDPRTDYELILTSGQALPLTDVTVTASNIADIYGNSAGILSVDFTPNDTNDDPAIALDSIDTEVRGDVNIGYALTDIEGDAINLSPRYSLDGGSNWLLMTTDSDTSGITSDNYAGSIIWKSVTDEPDLDNVSVMVRVHAIDNAFETGNFDQITFHLDNNDLPAALVTGSVYTAVDTTWAIGYTLSDTESDILSIDAEYSLDTGAIWTPAAVTGDTSGIASANYSGSLIWHVGRDVPSPSADIMLLRLIPRDNDPGTYDEVSLSPWNDHAPHVELSTPVAGEQSGNVTIEFQISDIDDSIVGLLAEYFSTDEVWEPASVTVSGDTSSLGVADYSGSFTWDSAADLTGRDIDSVMVRVTPFDTEAGQSDTLKIHIDNNAVPGLNGNNTTGTARDITLNFTLTDAENDTLRLWGYYSIDSRATWHLMTLVEDFSEILPGQYPSIATWRSFDDIGYARYDTAYVNLYAADRDTVGPVATDYIEDLVNYVGDYSGDTTIDFSDFATLTSAWNDQNTYHDIGPATGTPPDLVPTPDGEIDFEDLAVFSIMWNALAGGQPSLLMEERTVGYVRPGSRATSRETNEHPIMVQPDEPDDVWQQDDGVVTWDIEVREIAGLSAAHLVLQYDPAQLFLLDLEPGPFLGVMNGQDQSLIHLKRIDQQAGILELMLGRINSEDPDVGGTGILAIVRFREIVAAEHSFTVAYDLRDRSSTIIAAGRYEAQVESMRLPGEFALLQNYPNPFNGQTTIRFQLPSRQRVSLYLFNVRGQLVRTLLDEEMEPGYHKVTWDGRTEGGQTVASGIYIYLIQAGRNRQSLKLTIIK